MNRLTNSRTTKQIACISTSSIIQQLTTMSLSSSGLPYHANQTQTTSNLLYKTLFSNDRNKYTTTSNGPSGGSNTNEFAVFKFHKKKNTENKNNFTNNNNNNSYNRKPNNIKMGQMDKMVLISKTKELFKTDQKAALALLQQSLNLKRFQHHDIEVLFVWTISNGYLANIDIVNLFLEEFVSVNNVLNVSKLMNICYAKKIEMNLTTFETLIKYFTISNMKQNVDNLLARLDQSGLEKNPNTTYNILVDAYVYLGDMESALYYFNLVPSKIRNNLNSIIQYYIKTNQKKEAVDFLKTNIKDFPVFLESIFFSNFLKALDFDEITNIMDYLFQERLVDMQLLQTIISSQDHSIGALLLSRYNASDQVLLHLKVIKKAILRNDLKECLSLLKHMQDNNIQPSIPTLQSIISLCIAQNHREGLEQVVHHASILDPKANRFSSLIFYNQIKENTEIFQMLIGKLESMPITYIDMITDQIIRNFLQLGHYDLALHWYSERAMKYQISPSPILYSRFIAFHNLHNQIKLEDFWRHQRYELLKTEEFTFYEPFNIDQTISFIENFLVEQQQMEQLNSPITNDAQLKLQKHLHHQIQLKILSSKTTTNNNNNNNNRGSASIVDLKRRVYNPYFASHLPLSKDSIYGKNVKITMSDADINLQLSIDNRDIDKIIETILASYSNSFMPQGTLLLKGYLLVLEVDKEKYLYLLNHTPTFIRAMVHNMNFYDNLIRSDIDNALALIQQESPAFLTQNIVDSILQSLADRGRLDICMTLINLILTLDMKIKSIPYIFNKFLSQDAPTIDTSIVVPTLKTMEMKSTAEYGEYVKKSLLKLLIQRNLLQEAQDIFSSFEGQFCPITIVLGVELYSKLFPIPPVSNLNQWFTILNQTEKSKVRPLYFYQGLFKALLNQNQKEIIFKFLEKDFKSIKNDINPYMLDSILKCSSNPNFHALIVKGADPPINQLLVDSFNIISQANQQLNDPQITKILKTSQIVNPIYPPLSQESEMFMGQFLVNTLINRQKILRPTFDLNVISSIFNNTPQSVKECDIELKKYAQGISYLY